MTCCRCLFVGILLTSSWIAAMADDKQEQTKRTAQPAPPKAPAEISKRQKGTTEPANKKAEGEKAASPQEKAKETTSSATAKPAASAGNPAPAIYTVKKSPLKISVELDGYFESRKTREIFIKPEEWTGFRIVEVVPHGCKVKEGDVLLKLDTEKIDQAINDLQTDQRLGEVALRLAEEQLRVAELLAPLELDLGQRVARIADEDRATYFEADRPFYLKMAEFSLKDATNKLEYDEDELRQLEKMYKADDITEETEKIVLKRAQDTVERSKFGVEYHRLSRDQTVKFTVPRMDTQIKEMAQRKAIDWEKTKSELPLAIQKQRFELDKLKLQRERTAERLKKLQSDRAMMTIKSPMDGVVYYGKAVRGRFGDSVAMSETLRPQGTIQPNQMLMTVAQPDDLFIRAAVPEDQLHNLRRGQKGKATPAAYPDAQLGAVVERIGEVPTAPGSFDARFTLTGDDSELSLTPGMACKVRLTAYLKKDAITVPPKALVPDELQDRKFYVYVATGEGKSEKVSVTVGKRTDKKVEILDGLSEGDQVLMDPPRNN